MGIYMLPFLTPDDKQPMLADYMQHMVHALDVCGEDHVGIGTDSMFFTVTDKDLQAIKADEQHRRKIGVGAPGENRPPYIPDINTPRKLERVADALLKHGYSRKPGQPEPRTMMSRRPGAGRVQVARKAQPLSRTCAPGFQLSPE